MPCAFFWSQIQTEITTLTTIFSPLDLRASYPQTSKDQGNKQAASVKDGNGRKRMGSGFFFSLQSAAAQEKDSIWSLVGCGRQSIDGNLLFSWYCPSWRSTRLSSYLLPVPVTENSSFAPQGRSHYISRTDPAVSPQLIHPAREQKAGRATTRRLLPPPRTIPG